MTHLTHFGQPFPDTCLECRIERNLAEAMRRADDARFAQPTEETAVPITAETLPDERVTL